MQCSNIISSNLIAYKWVRFINTPLCWIIKQSLNLSFPEMVVFDEADRLFELGFGDQLREIVSRLPSSRQTLLFSATLPKLIVEFARAGLSDPVLIRLDIDWKLPSTLWLGWISVRAELKTAALLQLLDKVLTPTTPQAVVFAATKHHVEYLHLVSLFPYVPIYNPNTMSNLRCFKHR